MSKDNINFLIVSFGVIITSLTAIIIVKFDTEFNLRWVSFVFYLLSLSILPVFLILKNKPLTLTGRPAFKKILVKEYGFIFIIIISLFLNFLFLKNYPFVSTGDEVRDGGLNASQIINGEIKNIYDYGRYQSHGLIIPTVAGFFYPLFKNSVLTFRFPSALISFLSVIVIYVFVRKFSGKVAAFFAALTLTVSPFHLYYARTEIVIIFSSFLTSVILLMFVYFKEHKNYINYALLGLLLGFSSGFHASVRTIVFITFITLACLAVIQIIKRKNKVKTIGGLFILGVYFFIGFGPRLLYTTWEVFFHLRTVSLANNSLSNQSTSVIYNIFTNFNFNNYYPIFLKYIDSLRMYVDKPLIIIPFHFQTPMTFLPPLLTFFLVLGVFYIFIPKFKNKLKYLILYLLLIPFTNSAITDCFQCNYRLVPLLIVSVVFIGLGIEKTTYLLSKIKFLSKGIIYLLYLLFSFYLLFQAYDFFDKGLASKGKTYQEYLSMHSIYLLKSFPHLEKACLISSPLNQEFFDYMHIKEQYEYFLPNVKLSKTADPNILDNEIFLTKDCRGEEKYKQYSVCGNNENIFFCPLGSNKSINIYYGSSLDN